MNVIISILLARRKFPIRFRVRHISIPSSFSWLPHPISFSSSAEDAKKAARILVVVARDMTWADELPTWSTTKGEATKVYNIIVTPGGDGWSKLYLPFFALTHTRRRFHSRMHSFSKSFRFDCSRHMSRKNVEISPFFIRQRGQKRSQVNVAMLDLRNEVLIVRLNSYLS